ncbi:MAG: ABC transporter permease subunit [Ruthenibacterium lactatiformans]
MKAASTPFKKKKRQSGVWLTLLPLYLFTLVFVAGPLVYMVVLSFQTRAEVWGVVNQFTLDNYKNIFQPVYLNTFVESFKLALTSTALISAIGYPFGYFMAKLPAQWKKRVMLLLMIPFWTSSLIRLYGWIIIFRANGTLDKLLMGLGLTSPLKLLYTYPAVVVGMVYALLQFMILAVYSSAEKMDWSLVEAARDLGASPLKAFLTVTLKLTLPGLLSGVILTFIPSMGLFFIADILGGNKVVLVGSLIQDQLMKAHNWPFAAALSVVLMVLTTLMISLYKRVTHTTRTGGHLMKNRTKLPNIYLGVVTAVMYLPIVLVIIYSFNESKISSVWGGFSLKWYETLFRDGAMFEALGTASFWGCAPAWRRGRHRHAGCLRLHQGAARTKNAVEYISMLPIMIPEIILGMVFMAFFALIGLPFGMTTLILAHTAFCIPYVYMLVKARLVGMDKSLPEAARDLGAGEARVFFDITLPLLAPAILPPACCSASP